MMNRVENIDLRKALREIAELNTYFHLDNDLGISIEQMGDMWAHTNKLNDNRFAFHAGKLMEALNNHPEPNSPDKQSFITPLDGCIAYAFNPDQLGRLLKALPFDNAVFTVQKGKFDMNLIVPRDEVLELRRDPAEKSEKIGKPDKPEKPSLLAALEENEQRSCAIRRAKNRTRQRYA